MMSTSTFVPNIADTDPEAYLRIAQERAWVADSLALESMDEFREKLNGNWHAMREKLVGLYSWAIPNREAIEKLVALSPIVEIGAGGGYWAWLVNNNGGRVHAYDINPAPDGSNDYMDFSWGGVRKGGPEKVLDHQSATLFLCWPDYRGTVAYEAARRYEGDTIVYIGEWTGGCTGDFNFFRLCGDEDLWAIENDPPTHDVKPQWQIEETITIPQFWGLHDAMFILRRVDA